MTWFRYNEEEETYNPRTRTMKKKTESRRLPCENTTGKVAQKNIVLKTGWN